MGDNSSASSFNMRAGMPSGPDALFGRRSFISFRTPASETIIDSMRGVWGPIKGTSLSVLALKTEANWLLSMLAFTCGSY